MALVSVARYADLQEARIAASRLDSAGIMSLVPDANLGSTNFFLGQAIGGYRLCVIDEDLQAARDVLTGCRTENPDALNWRDHPDAVTAAPSSIFWAVVDPTAGGWAWGSLRRRFSLPAAIVLVLSLAMIVTLVALTALSGAGP
ncbi:MAG TPA: hypothetical protein PLO65_11045 [Caulobacter sp.]|nr:hypothetical protein [Caulobacter sp.]